MSKIISAQEAVDLIPSGSSIMFGGFMGCGNAHQIIDELSKRSICGLTMICNDAAMLTGPLGEAYYGVSKLIRNKQVRKLIATHVGLNPKVAQQVNEGSLELELIPQGSFVEMIRAGGAGLGGVITPTGVGTIVEQAAHVHSKINIDGRTYLIERPLRADFAIISGHKIDPCGNVWYRGTTRNFSHVMATAANVVIAEADVIADLGDIAPEDVVTPGVFIDYIVDGGKPNA